MTIDIDTEAEEISDVRKARKSGDSVVLTLTTEITRQAGVCVGDEVKITTPFSGGEITITLLEDESEGGDQSPQTADA